MPPLNIAQARNIFIIGFCICVFVMLYFILGSLVLGTGTTYFDSAMDGNSIYLMREAGEPINYPLTTLVVLLMFFFLPFLLGWYAILIGSFLIPNDHQLLRTLVTGCGHVIMTSSLFTAGFLLYSELYASSHDAHRTGVVLSALSYYLMDIVAEIAVLALSLSLYQTQRLPRWFAILGMVISVSLFAFDVLITNNPNATDFRLIISPLILTVFTVISSVLIGSQAQPPNEDTETLVQKP